MVYFNGEAPWPSSVSGKIGNIHTVAASTPFHRTALVLKAYRWWLSTLWPSQLFILRGPQCRERQNSKIANSNIFNRISIKVIACSDSYDVATIIRSLKRATKFSAIIRNSSWVIGSLAPAMRRFWTVGWSRIVLERPTQVVDTLMGSGGIIL